MSSWSQRPRQKENTNRILVGTCQLHIFKPCLLFNQANPAGVAQLPWRWRVQLNSADVESTANIPADHAPSYPAFDVRHKQLRQRILFSKTVLRKKMRETTIVWAHQWPGTGPCGGWVGHRAGAWAVVFTSVSSSSSCPCSLVRAKVSQGRLGMPPHWLKIAA